jgi:hypothetical protein
VILIFGGQTATSSSTTIPFITSTNICTSKNAELEDLNFIDGLAWSLLFADSLDAWSHDSGAKRKNAKIPTKGKLRRGVRTNSFFILSCIEPGENGKRKFQPRNERNYSWASSYELLCKSTRF